MKKQLGVYWNADRVGILEIEKDRRLKFAYETSWLKTPNAGPISFALPLREAPYGDEKARPYFANLLPEAKIRTALSQTLGISVENDFGLLEAIGGECAGAISLWPGERGPPNDGNYDPLTELQLEDLIKDMPNRPLLAGPGKKSGLRLSLAGAQAKVPVYLHDGRIFLPRGSYSSTHIVKPAIPTLKHTVVNELYCMKLARACGLNVPETEMILSGKARSFCIKRYDRIESKEKLGEVIRLHQEDFCQALSVMPDGKYEAEGGPGFAQCFELVSDCSSEPATDRFQLLKWVAYNHLIGNADAHAKNLSFIYEEGSLRLAPFYDLLATRFYPQLTDQAAMQLGGEKRLDAVTKLHWKRFADDVEIKFKLVVETVTEVANHIRHSAKTTSERVVTQYGSLPGLGELQTSIVKRCEKTLRKLGG